MTIEKLRNLRGMISNIKALDEEIDKLYSPIGSPNGRASTGGTRSNVPGDPTARSAMKIIEMKEEIEKNREEMYELLKDVEKWLRELGPENAEIASIIRWHYILGYPWNITNLKVFGYKNYDNSRKMVERFFKK